MENNNNNTSELLIVGSFVLVVEGGNSFSSWTSMLRLPKRGGVAKCKKEENRNSGQQSLF